MRDFVYICKKTQKDLKDYVAEKLKETHNKVISEDGYVYAQGSFPVLLVAHLDTVHKQLPKTIMYDPETFTLSSDDGIGGDDRCGVYMIFEIIKKFNCSVLFCEDEEVGGVGADKFVRSELAAGLSFNYIIELDRRGENDAVFYDCDNEEFEAFITQDFYKTAFGTFSDISTIAPFLKCAAVNLSCGYYHEHTKNEYVNFSQMKASINAVCCILDRTTKADKYEYIEATNTYPWYSGYYGCQDDTWYIEYFDGAANVKFEMVTASSEAEALGKFLMNNPHMSFDMVIDIFNIEGEDDTAYCTYG
jgi:di/tripeptidase